MAVYADVGRTLYPLTRATVMDRPLHPQQNAITYTRGGDGE